MFQDGLTTNDEIEIKSKEVGIDEHYPIYRLKTRSGSTGLTSPIGTVSRRLYVPNIPIMS